MYVNKEVLNFGHTLTCSYLHTESYTRLYMCVIIMKQGYIYNVSFVVDLFSTMRITLHEMRGITTMSLVQRQANAC